MQIINDISMHLDRREPTPVIDVVQGETARAVTLFLYDKGELWTVPQDASVLIRYRKSDSTGGIYDSMPDGKCAWQLWENAVTIRIAPQALAIAGQVQMQIALVAEGEELASFIFCLRVEADPSVGTLASEDYINIGQWLMPRIYRAVYDAEAAASNAIQAAEQARQLAAGVSGRIDLNYEAFALDPYTGELMGSELAICSDHFPVLRGRVGVVFPDLVTVRLFYYDRSHNFLSVDLVQTESFEKTVPEGAEFARLEVRYATGLSVYDKDALAEYVTVYIPDSVGKPLTLQQATYDGKRQALGTYDGTADTEITIPTGFAYIDENSGKTLYDVKGPTILNGTIKVHEDQADTYHFAHGYAFGQVYAGVRMVYAFDIRNNIQYRFSFDKSSLVGKHTMKSAPLVAENTAEGGSGGGYQLLQHIVTTERASSILVNTEAKTPAFYRIRMYVPKLPEGESASGNSKFYVNGDKGVTNFKLMSSGSNVGHLDAQLSCIAGSLTFSVFCSGAGVDAAATKVGFLSESAISTIEITAASNVDFPIGTEFYLWEMEGDAQ